MKVNLFMDANASYSTTANGGEPSNIGNALSTTGWNAVVDKSPVTVPAKGSTTATFTVSAPAKADFVTATIVAVPVADGFIGNATELDFEALSANAKYISIGYNGVFRESVPKYADFLVTVPCDSLTMFGYDFTKYDIVLFDPLLLDYSSYDKLIRASYLAFQLIRR
jgi:hypothetical protein